MPASVAGTDGGRLAGEGTVMGIALELSRDGADRAIEPLGNLVFRVSHLLPVSPDFIQRVEGAAFTGEDVLCALGPPERL